MNLKWLVWLQPITISIFLLLLNSNNSTAQVRLIPGQWRIAASDTILRVTTDSLILGIANSPLAKASYSQHQDTLLLPKTVASSLWPSGEISKIHLHWTTYGQHILLTPLYNGNQPGNRLKPISMRLVLPKGSAAFDWSYLDLETDSVPGISLYKAYSLLKGRKGRPVVVGILDTGFDEMHPELANRLWTNPDEISMNRRDDDKNGYIDDVHGWYWLCFSDQRLLEHDQAEATRILAANEKSNQNEVALSKATTEFNYQKQRYNRLRFALTDSINLIRTIGTLTSYFRNQPFNIDSIRSIAPSKDTLLASVKQLLIDSYRGQSISFADQGQRLITNRKRFLQILSEGWLYAYNVDYKPLGNPPQALVGSGNSVASDQADKLLHGTHVAGIVAGFSTDNQRYNLPEFIQLMNLGAGPSSGDERDEMLAKAIRYATQKGARIINISMAKRLSAQKQLVDSALLFAEKNDVLIINCAGNDNVNTDEQPYYPIAQLTTGHNLNNWIEVGNSTVDFSSRLVYYSSNYGRNSVDLFAPGTLIRSTVPHASYANLTGTSMAAPLVARVAALLRSYFPRLTAPQIRSILIKSVTKPTILVNKPGTSQQVSMTELCQSGGLLNAYNAVQLAIQMDQKEP